MKRGVLGVMYYWTLIRVDIYCLEIYRVPDNKDYLLYFFKSHGTF